MVLGDVWRALFGRNFPGGGVIFHAEIDCTGTDNQKQRNKTTCAPKTHKSNTKTCGSQDKHKTKNAGLVDFYSMQPVTQVKSMMLIDAGSDEPLCPYIS